MAKISYTATFDDGSIITRKSDREYRAAWRVNFRGQGAGAPWPEDHSATGFSRTDELAAKAARQYEGGKYYISTEIVTVVGGGLVVIS